MFQKVKERVSAAAADPRLDKTKAGLKEAETGIWRALEPVGRWSNRQAGKLGMESFWPTDLATECDKAARILRTFTVTGAQADSDPSAERTGGVIGGATKTPEQLERERKEHKYDARKTQKVVKKIPPEIIAQAKGIAIFTVFRTGFGFSGASGSGVVLKRLPDGSWSGPSGLLLHTIGWGLLIGLDIYDVVLVLRTDRAVDAFRNPKISVGAEIAVAAGPVGNGAMVDSGLEASPAFSYVKSKGFYAGLQLDGNIILKRGDENSRFYNTPDVSTADILSGKIQPPRGAYPLLKTLYHAEGRPPPPSVSYLGADVVIPEGPAPGDVEISEEDAAALEAEAKAQDAGSSSSASGTAAVPTAAGHSTGPGVSSAVAGAGAGIGAASLGTSGGATQKKAEVWEQPPPDYDFSTAPPSHAAQLTVQHGSLPPVPADMPADYAAVPPPTSAAAAAPLVPLSAEEEKERLRQRDAAEAAALAGQGSSASTASQQPYQQQYAADASAIGAPGYDAVSHAEAGRASAGAESTVPPVRPPPPSGASNPFAG